MPSFPSITLPLWHGLAPKWPTELAFLAQYRAKRLFNAVVHQPLVPRLSDDVFGRIEQPLTLADADLVQTLQARLEWLELHALKRFTRHRAISWRARSIIAWWLILRGCLMVRQNFVLKR